MTMTTDSVEALQFKLGHVRANILRYFGSIPHFAREAGYAGGESLVSMGNGLFYIAGELELGITPAQPVGEPAETVQNLAKQFQEVGRELWHFDPSKNSGLSAKVHRLEFQVRSLQQMVVRNGVVA